MQRTMPRSTLRRSTVTGFSPHHADILEHEQAHAVDAGNGARLETSTTAEERGSGTVVNASAARKA